MSGVLLEATAEGERLKLAGTGAWIAENAHAWRHRSTPRPGASGAVKRVDIDMAGSTGSIRSAPGCWSG